MKEDVDVSKCYIIFLIVINVRKIIKFICEVKSNRIIFKYVIKILKSIMIDRILGL